MRSITYKELKNLMLFSNVNIIDIRSNSDYIKSHLSNSININYNELIQKPERIINKNNIYYILCDTGYTSYKVSVILHDKGYNVINVTDGYHN